MKSTGKNTRFLPGEESCKEASWRTGLGAKPSNLRTAGPASPACPEAVGALLFQFASAAFTALKEGFLLLF